MKKFTATFKKSLFLISLCCLVGLNMQSQVVTLSQGFDNYDGTLPSVPSGWHIRWNTSASFYTTTSNVGLSAPSYKFGIDQDTMITESFAPSDTLSFWCKGEGATFSSFDTLTILWSPDSSSWYLLTYQDNLPTTGTILTFPVNPYATHLMFIFTKYMGNLALDDIKLTYDSTTGINDFQNPSETFKLYPNPSTGQLFINNNSSSKTVKITVMDVLGNEIINLPAQSLLKGKKELNLSSLQNGMYFLKIQDGNNSEMRKISVVK